MIKINFVKKKSATIAYFKPISDFLERYGRTALIILLLIGLYRIADIVMGVVANIFYLDKGYNVKEIATYSKFFGVFATIVGGIIGGYSAIKVGTLKALFFGALIVPFVSIAISNLLKCSASIKFLCS